MRILGRIALKRLFSKCPKREQLHNAINAPLLFFYLPSAGHVTFSANERKKKEREKKAKTAAKKRKEAAEASSNTIRSPKRTRR